MRRSAIHRGHGFGPRTSPLSPKGKAARRNETRLEAFRREVRERAGGDCQVCDRPGHQAHHLHTKGARPDLATDPANGCWLCAECHFKEGHPFSTRFRRAFARKHPYFAAIYNPAKDELLLGLPEGA